MFVCGSIVWWWIGWVCVSDTLVSTIIVWDSIEEPIFFSVVWVLVDFMELFWVWDETDFLFSFFLFFVFSSESSALVWPNFLLRFLIMVSRLSLFKVESFLMASFSLDSSSIFVFRSLDLCFCFACSHFKLYCFLRSILFFSMFFIFSSNFSILMIFSDSRSSSSFSTFSKIDSSCSILWSFS